MTTAMISPEALRRLAERVDPAASGEALRLDQLAAALEKATDEIRSLALSLLDPDDLDGLAQRLDAALPTKGFAALVFNFGSIWDKLEPLISEAQLVEALAQSSNELRSSIYDRLGDETGERFDDANEARAAIDAITTGGGLSPEEVRARLPDKLLTHMARFIDRYFLYEVVLHFAVEAADPRFEPSAKRLIEDMQAAATDAYRRLRPLLLPDREPDLVLRGPLITEGPELKEEYQDIEFLQNWKPRAES